MTKCSAVTKKGTRCTGLAKIYTNSNGDLINYLCNLHINMTENGKIFETIIPESDVIIYDTNYNNRNNILVNVLINIKIPTYVSKTISSYDSLFEGKLLCSLNLHNQKNHISFLSDNRLITNYNNCKLKIWGEIYNIYHKSETERKIMFQDIIFTGHQTKIDNIFVLSNNKIISNSNMEIKVWDSNTGTCEMTLYSNFNPYEIKEISPTEISILMTNGDFEIWNLETKQLRFQINTSLYPCHTYLPENKLFISAADGSISIWNLDNGERELFLISDTEIKLIAYIPNNIKYQLATINRKMELQFWTLPFEDSKISLKQDFVVDTLNILNNNQIELRSKGGIIKIIDINNLDKQKRLRIELTNITHCIKLSDDIHLSKSSSGTISVWNFETNECLFKLPESSDPDSNILMTPYNKLFYTTKDLLKILY